ncbi:MAG: ATP-dependent DNA helicase RecQ [Rhodothermales bacterium]
MNTPETNILHLGREVLTRHWGHDDFRPGQWEIISHVLDRRDVLAILPTGGGKSVCYQVPAMLREGLTLVVSPLIALMQDQVAGLHERGISATFINSSLSVAEIDQRWTDAEHGKYKLVYIAPERLQSEVFLARAERLDVALLAVDEAHCISEWGHNFRPAYLEIATARDVLGRPPTLAVTATATPRVRRDIVEHLKLEQPKVIVRGFDRPNVVWSNFRTENKRSKVLDILRGVSGSGIIYSATRRGAEEWGEWLEHQKISAAVYHGGMRPAVRALMQEAWLGGEKRVMVATNAFGMGIDKPNVRFVIHVDLPATLEGYYQEAGRGGRDGKTSYAVLIYHPHDDETPRVLIDQSHPTAREVRKTYDAVCSLAQIAIGSTPDHPVVVRPDAVAKVTGLSTPKIRTAVELIARQEIWSVLPVRKHFGLIRFTQPAENVRAYAASKSNEALARFVDELLRTIHAEAFSSWWEVDLRNLERRTGLQREKLLRGLDFLRRHELFDWHAPERALRIHFLEARSNRIPIDGRTVKAARERAEEKLKDIIRYARSSGCRRHFLLTYFGEAHSDRCGTCDVCLRRHDPFVARPEDEPIAHHILRQVAAKMPRAAWFDTPPVPQHRIDGLVNWLLQEGMLRQTRPLTAEFEVTVKARRVLARSNETSADPNTMNP